MTDKQPSKADQVAALRVARANRPKTKLERLDAALALRLPEAKSSDGSGDTEFAVLHPSEQSGHAAMGKRVGVSSDPSEAKRGRPRLGEKRSQPWLNTKPPMSERTWYRRQAEKREAEK